LRYRIRFAKTGSRLLIKKKPQVPERLVLRLKQLQTS